MEPGRWSQPIWGSEGDMVICGSRIEEIENTAPSAVSLPAKGQSRVAARMERGFQAQVRHGPVDPPLRAERRVAAEAGADRLDLRLEPRRSTPRPNWGRGPPGRDAAPGSRDRQRAGPEARPRPHLGPIDQSRAEWVPLDGPQDDQRMLVLLDRKGREAALPDVPGGAVVSLVAADVALR